MKRRIVSDFRYFKGEAFRLPFASAFAVVCFVFAASALLQAAGWRQAQAHRSGLGLIAGVVIVALLLVALIALLGMLRNFVRAPMTLMAVLSVVMIAIWFRVVGFRSAVQDALVLVIAYLTLGVLHQKYLGPALVGSARSRVAVAFWGGFWLTVTLLAFLADFLSARLLPLKLEVERPRSRYEAASISAGVAPGGGVVALALSGGGYRAAVMHAGVINHLLRSDVPITAVSTVSGGSIVGAFVAAGGAPADFRDAVGAGRFNLVREVFHLPNLAQLLASQRVLGSDLRWFPVSEFTRTHVQGSLLDRLFLHERTLRSLSVSNQLGFSLMVCVTDITGGSLVGLTRGGYVEQRIDPVTLRLSDSRSVSGAAEPTFIPFGSGRPSAWSDTLPASLIVAASGAFPGAFEPLRSARVASGETGAVGLESILADGGVADNLGVVLAYAAASLARTSAGNGVLADWNVSGVIASDGSALPMEATPRSLMGALGRSVDVMYRATAGVYLLPSRVRDSLPRTTVLSPRSLLSAPQREEAADSLIAYELEEGSRRLSEVMGFKGQLLLRSLQKDTSSVVARIALREHLMQDLEDVVRVFRLTSTLKDQMSPDEASSLFRLGEYLAILGLHRERKPAPVTSNP